MFDTHCHLNFKSFKKNLADVVKGANNAGIFHILVPGTDCKLSERAVEIANQYQNVYAAVGIHPHHIYQYQKLNSKYQNYIANIKNDLKSVESLLSDQQKIVAIGEVGLDYYDYEKTKYGNYEINDEFKALQKKLFVAQVQLAIKHNKSLILHNREAIDDFLRIIGENWNEKLTGKTVFHCCEADDKLLDFAINHQIYIGVDGDVTFSKEKQEFVKKIPRDLLVLETDSPFLLPEPLRSQKKYPNKPENIKIIAEFLADLLGIELKKIQEATFNNSLKLFEPLPTYEV